MDLDPYFPLVEAAARAVYRTMRGRVQHRLIAREDLAQAGYIGLIEAARRFDPSRGASFKTFAYQRIRGAILDELRASLPLSRQHWADVEAGRCEFFEDPLTDLHAERLPSREDIEGQIEQAVLLWRVRHLMTRLPARLRRILRLQAQHLTHREIAEMLGVSEPRIQELAIRATMTLRKQIALDQADRRRTTAPARIVPWRSTIAPAPKTRDREIVQSWNAERRRSVAYALDPDKRSFPNPHRKKRMATATRARVS